MLEIITGDKGKGKTKVLIEKVNNDVKVVAGSVVFIDNNNKHLYELSNRVNMINCSNYNIEALDMFIGFILGIISQDKDIEKIYIDNFTTIVYSDKTTVEEALDKVKEVSDKYEIEFVICFATDVSTIPEKYTENIIAAL